MGGDSGMLSMEEMAQQFNGGYGEVGHPHTIDRNPNLKH